MKLRQARKIILGPRFQWGCRQSTLITALRRYDRHERRRSRLSMTDVRDVLIVTLHVKNHYPPLPDLLFWLVVGTIQGRTTHGPRLARLALRPDAGERLWAWWMAEGLPMVTGLDPNPDLEAVEAALMADLTVALTGLDAAPILARLLPVSRTIAARDNREILGLMVGMAIPADDGAMLEGVVLAVAEAP
jgi:hypothetical protein